VTTLQRRATFDSAESDRGALLWVQFPELSRPVIWIDRRKLSPPTRTSIVGSGACGGLSGLSPAPGGSGSCGGGGGGGDGDDGGGMGGAGLQRSATLPRWAEERLATIVLDPLLTLSLADKELLWSLRHSLISHPEALPKFLLAVDWARADQVNEAYMMLQLWQPLEPIHALQLLDHQYPDPKVRAFAVHCLEALADEKLAAFTLQLVQVLKYEAYHDSALARFLLRRAVSTPQFIGHEVFWFLKAEMHCWDVWERFGVLLSEYLRNCGAHRVRLGQQIFVMRKLEEVANHVAAQDSKRARKECLREHLQNVVWPSTFQLPVDPAMRATNVIVKKCRVMESKKKPLWLVFENADYDPAPSRVRHFDTDAAAAGSSPEHKEKRKSSAARASMVTSAYEASLNESGLRGGAGGEAPRRAQPQVP
jgi:hypothetical protein